MADGTQKMYSFIKCVLGSERLGTTAQKMFPLPDYELESLQCEYT